METDGTRTLMLFAEFTDGYCLRNLIEYAKSTNTSGNFIFTPDKILYARADANSTLVNEFIISACNLSYYEYRSEEPEIAVGIKLSDLRSITKSIGRKDGLRIRMYQGDPLFHLEIVTSNTKGMNRNNENTLRPQTVSEPGYEVGEYAVDSQPNYKISVADFCRSCMSMNSIKCSSVLISCYPNSITFEGTLEGGIVGRRDFYHRLPDGQPETGEPTRTLRVRVNIIKSLSKLVNVCNGTGVIRFFLGLDEANDPLRLRCKIGAIGHLNIYLQEAEP